MRILISTAAAGLMTLHGIAAAAEIKVMIPPPVREALESDSKRLC